jgi:predicted PurR-regulated permease PerM
VPYALALAVISGILEIVPTLGPILAGAIATIFALTIDPIKAIFVIILYVIVQQLENNFVVPKVMQKAVGLSPVIIIFAVLIGARLLGLVGAILAVPIAASISVIVQDWSTVKKTIGR